MTRNGWMKFEKKAGGNKYSAYDTKIVVIVSPGKTPYFYLPKSVMETLQNAESVDVYTRGSNIGLFPSENGTGYRVCRNPTSGKDRSSQTPYVSLTALAKQWNIQAGVYEAHVEDGGVVFDTRQTPSKPV